MIEDEDELAVDLERLNAEREEKLTREQLLSDRGVGIRAFEWRHLQKNLGLEYWLGDILAIRVGCKVEPGINLPNFTDYLTGGIGVKLFLFNLDLSYRANPGPGRASSGTIPGLIEVTGIIIF